MDMGLLIITSSGHIRGHSQYHPGAAKIIDAEIVVEDNDLQCVAYQSAVL
jgi:hypothetical protein